MFENIGILSGFIASIFILMYTLMYLFKDFYFISRNNFSKKYINKLLHFINKSNLTFLIIILTFSIIHFFFLVMFSTIINSGYVVLFVLLITFKIAYFSSSKENLSLQLNILSYLLLASLVIHIFI